MSRGLLTMQNYIKKTIIMLDERYFTNTIKEKIQKFLGSNYLVVINDFPTTDYKMIKTHQIIE